MLSRPLDVEAIEVGKGAIVGLTASELGQFCWPIDLPRVDDEAWRIVADATSHRISQRASVDIEEAIRFGAFSYLVEVLRLLPNEGEAVRDLAIEIAEAFLNQNASLRGTSLSKPDLQRFALAIQSNGFDWDDLLVAYLDPEAVRLDRLRQNLKLSPSERWKRHRKLIPQLKKARRV